MADAACLSCGKTVSSAQVARSCGPFRRQRLGSASAACTGDSSFGPYMMCLCASSDPPRMRPDTSLFRDSAAFWKPSGAAYIQFRSYSRLGRVRHDDPQDLSGDDARTPSRLPFEVGWATQCGRSKALRATSRRHVRAPQSDRFASGADQSDGYSTRLVESVRRRPSK